MSEVFLAGCADDEETFRTIRSVYETNGYLMDTHTAVAQNVYERYQDTLQGKTVILSTASAYKFSAAVLDALGADYADEFDAMAILSKKTGVCVPGGLADILTKEVVHHNVIEKNDMRAFVENYIKGGISHE